MKASILKDLISVAKGQYEAELVIKNANIVNVFTKEIIKADIAIQSGYIASIGDYSSSNEIDAKGAFITPGFIDAHMHFESSMVLPQEFASAVLPHGTTTVIADPHEIANTSGINGIKFMLDATNNIPLNVFFMMPSCVPSTSFETNGFNLNADEMKKLFSHERIIGLGEVMSYEDILKEDDDIINKIELFKDKIADGHSPGLYGKNLNAYCACGIKTDHECYLEEEVIEKMRLGMHILIREGSAAKNLDILIKTILKHDLPKYMCCFCTDDKHLHDIKKEGHIVNNIRKAIKLGLNPIDAICMATIYPAELYRLNRIGAIAPGYKADMVLISNLEEFNIEKTIKDGKIIYENSSLNIDKKEKILIPKELLNTIKIKEISKEDIKIKILNEYANVINVIPYELVTKLTKENVPKVNHEFIPNSRFLKIAVIERYGKNKNIGLGILSGINIKNAAIASTVAHDSHNLIVLGDNDEDILIAIDELKKCGGGLALVINKIPLILPLEISGILTKATYEEIQSTLNMMEEKLYEMGIDKKINPFMLLSFLALPVIPDVKITDKGIFNVIDQMFLPIENNN